MHHSFLLLIATLITASPLTLEAQTPAPEEAPPSTPGALVQGGGGFGGSEAQSSELTRFDLDFPGGTPGELVAAISKAMGKHLNVIIPTSHANAKIMPLKVEGVTVPQLFAAIQSASRRQMAQVTSMGTSGKSVQYKNVGIDFGIAGGGALDNETVWAFTSTEPTPEEDAILSMRYEPEQVCQYFQLAPYLQDHTIEDITTAIRTGWGMLKVDPAPLLSFHQETKLLIAVGAAPYVAQIPQVLQQLPLDNSTAVEKIAKLQAELAEIKQAKAAGWEAEATEIQSQINRVAALQKARETIQNLPAQNQLPRTIVPRSRNQ